jgi:septation ring formation regulator EzrA
MMDEKDVIGLMAGTIESTNGAVDNSVCDNGNAAVSKETFETMMNSIDSRLSTLSKRVYNLEYTEQCASSPSLYMKELRKDLNSLMHKVDQIEAALSMSKKYRKRRAKLSRD